MINILLADDHEIVRRGLKKIFETEYDLKVISEAKNGFEVLEFINYHDYDLLILDINMPGKSGLEVLTEVKKIKPHIKILILSIYPEDNFAINAFEQGAAGYLTKDVVSDELIKAIRRINEGKKYVSESLAEKLAARIELKPEKIIHDNLSKREMEILLLIGEGKTPSEIAEILNLSHNTIATYRARILEKMNMKSNAALIYYVIKNNLM